MERKKVLIIQSYRGDENVLEEQREYREVIGDMAELSFVSLVDENVSWHDPQTLLTPFDGVIFGGSSEFDFDGSRTHDDPVSLEAKELLERARPLIDYILEKNIPCLGICFGHQMIALAQGGAVAHDTEQNKLGTFEVDLTPVGAADPLFGQLPHTFFAQYDHKDSVTRAPHSAHLLGVGERCFASILRYGHRCYTMQFHVEFDERVMQEEYRDFSVRFPEGTDPHSLIKPSPEASTIIPRFLALL